MRERTDAASTEPSTRLAATPDARRIADDALRRRRDINADLVRFVLLPTIFLIVALLGGVRVAADTRALLFIAPPLVALILAALLVVLFARANLIRLDSWFDPSNAPVVNISHALTLVALFAASAQAFNSVLPERGLFKGAFAFFFLWTLWNNLFAPFDARTFLRSTAILFGTAFVIKHFLLASLFGAEDRSLLERITGALVEGVSLGAVSAPAFAPATGYISFFTLVLFIMGLFLTPRDAARTEARMSVERRAAAPHEHTPDASEIYDRLTPAERARLREMLLNENEDSLQPKGDSSSAISSRTTS